jgi:hypothetical protein
MSAPAVVSLTANTWTAVATAIQICRVVPQTVSNNYLATYRLTGAAAPTTDTDAIPVRTRQLSIKHSELIDVYVKSQGQAGSVVVHA